MSFTKKRSHLIANQRASAFHTVAQRIAICPLNISAKEILLASAGAPKFSFGLELGSCDIKTERSLRSVVSRALWSKSHHKSNDVLFTICHKGHLFDPTQLKLYFPFKIARRQLMKHAAMQHFWTQLWHDTANTRSRYKDGRSNMVGPLSTLFCVSHQIGWNWVDPFTFQWQVDETTLLTIPLLGLDEHYFLHLVRLAIARLLWRRAAAARKNLRGIERGIDKKTTTELLNSQQLDPYDCGILRAIFVDGISTQKHLWNMRQADHPVCQYCWAAEETLVHLFWECPIWQNVRLRYLTDSQLERSAQLPLCIRRTGLFINTAEQCAQINTIHVQALAGQQTNQHIAHTCEFSLSVHKMMIDIIKSRNHASTRDAPDDFDPSLYKRLDPKQNPPVLIVPDSSSHEPSHANTDVPETTHSPEGFLLSASKRPGGSKFQYVQYLTKTQKYKVCIPHAGQRHSFGPFLIELEAAKTV